MRKGGPKDLPFQIRILFFTTHKQLRVAAARRGETKVGDGGGGCCSCACDNKGWQRGRGAKFAWLRRRRRQLRARQGRRGQEGEEEEGGRKGRKKKRGRGRREGEEEGRKEERKKKRGRGRREGGKTFWVHQDPTRVPYIPHKIDKFCHLWHHEGFLYPPKSHTSMLYSQENGQIFPLQVFWGTKILP